MPVLSGMQRSLARARQNFTVWEETREGLSGEEEWPKRMLRKRNVHAVYKLASLP